MSNEFAEKNANWGHWSSKNVGFPPEMEEEIKQINLDRGLDIWDSYGFRVRYYMYMEDWDRETTEEYFRVDDSYRIYGT